jgi:hypothetical protein
MTMGSSVYHSQLCERGDFLDNTISIATGRSKLWKLEHDLYHEKRRIVRHREGSFGC